MLSEVHGVQHDVSLDEFADYGSGPKIQENLRIKMNAKHNNPCSLTLAQVFGKLAFWLAGALGKRAALPRRYVAFLALLVTLLFIPPALAQETTGLTLNLRRDFGFGMGSSIQGTFSLRVTGPDDLQRVIFYMDDQVLAEVNQPPFRHQFNTDNYPPGVHTYRAVGFTAGGEELTSNGITRNVVTAGEGNRAAIWIVVPILLLSLVVPLLLGLLTRRRGGASGDVPIDGLFGGAICPKCKRPFARHWWGLNLITGKLDRCPHCGRWSLVRQAHPDLLKASYDAMKQADAENAPLPPTTDSDDLRRRLDDSRFD